MENKELEDSPIEVVVRGVATEVFVLVLIALLVAAAGDIYLASSRAPQQDCRMTEAAQKSQLDNQRVQLSITQEQERSIFMIETKVADACVAKGGTPVFAGGNVSCQK